MPALSGELRVVSLPALVQLLRSESLTGRLELDETGTVDLREGRPVAARCGPLEGEVALLELFLKEPGPFVFDAEAQPADAPPLGEVIDLVMDGCRLTDEWDRVRTQAVSLGEGVTLLDHRASRPVVRPLRVDEPRLHRVGRLPHKAPWRRITNQTVRDLRPLLGEAR